MTSDPVILEPPSDGPTEERKATPPLTVNLIGGKRFRAASDHWAYQELGVFGRGYFSGAQHRSTVVLIPYDRIEYLEFEIDEP